jgi:hypothetical protein
MIEIFTGVPGAGKTYLAVKTLSEKYYDYDKSDQSFVRKKEFEDYTIITNIDSLSLPGCKDLIQIFKDANLNFDSFFTPGYQEKLHNKYPHVVYVLDEVQQFIPPRFTNKDTILYFDTHRHYGDHIIMITQDLAKISRSISTLCEMEYRAVKQTMSLFGEFKYNLKSGGEIFKRQGCKPDKKIFALYKSFVGNDQKKIKNNLKYYILFFLVAFVGLGYYFFNYSLTKNRREIEETKKEEPAHVHQISGEKIKEEQPKPDEIKHIPITAFVATADDRLISFQDPLTGNVYTGNNSPYQIKYFHPTYYIFIKQSKLQQLTMN